MDLGHEAKEWGQENAPDRSLSPHLSDIQPLSADAVTAVLRVEGHDDHRDDSRHS